jgi:type IV secretory pathway protease TraF
MENPDFLPALSSKGKSVAITNAAASGDLTVHTTTAGKRFVVYHVWLQAEGATDITFKSGATALSGPLAFAINAERGWISSGVPIIRGNAVGDNFVIAISAAVQVNGFALVGEIEA